MTDQDAYRRYTTAAELCLAQIEQFDTDRCDAAMAYAGAAQVWAMLALAAAQDRVQPAGRPTDDLGRPRRVRDGQGDMWDCSDDGLYTSPSSPGEALTLSGLANRYNGYTEVT